MKNEKQKERKKWAFRTKETRKNPTGHNSSCQFATIMRHNAWKSKICSNMQNSDKIAIANDRMLSDWFAVHCIALYCIRIGFRFHFHNLLLLLLVLLLKLCHNNIEIITQWCHYYFCCDWAQAIVWVNELMSVTEVEDNESETFY